MSGLTINGDRIAYDTIDREVVIIHFDTGSYYSLQPPAAEIWEMITRGAALGEILSSLCRTYIVSEAEARASILGFLRELAEQDLITLDESRYADGQGVTADPVAPSAQRSTFVPPVLQSYTDMKLLLQIDPIHNVDQSGWPRLKPTDEAQE